MRKEEAIRQHVDAASIHRATRQARESVENVLKCAEDVRTDPCKSVRLDRQMCVACFYLRRRVGGASTTYAECGVCGEVMRFPNTCIDTVCIECAQQHRLCRWCGGDIEVKHRRKPRDFGREGT
jgi:hypothetical protein